MPPAPRRPAASCRSAPPLAATTLNTRYVLVGMRTPATSRLASLLGGHCVVTGRRRRAHRRRRQALCHRLRAEPARRLERLAAVPAAAATTARCVTRPCRRRSAGDAVAAGPGFCRGVHRRRPPGQLGRVRSDPRARVDHAFDAHHKTSWPHARWSSSAAAPDHAYFRAARGRRQGMMFAALPRAVRRHHRRCAGDACQPAGPPSRRNGTASGCWRLPQTPAAHRSCRARSRRPTSTWWPKGRAAGL